MNLIKKFIYVLACASMLFGCHNSFESEISSDYDGDGAKDTVRLYNSKNQIILERRLNVPSSGVNKIFFLSKARKIELKGEECLETDVDMNKTYAGKNAKEEGRTIYYTCGSRVVMTKYVDEAGRPISATLMDNNETIKVHYEDSDREGKFDKRSEYANGRVVKTTPVDLPAEANYDTL